MSSILKEQIQQVAHSKTGVAVGVGGVTAKGWVDYVLNDPTFQAGIIIVGLALSLTLITVHVFALYDRWKR
jgi:hypothetical protein